jgi:phosphatidylglycerophosphate synthase
MWFAAAALQFIGHQLDGLDGIQARRTGMSTPTGELFDHGMDSMVCSLQSIASASALALDPHSALYMQMGITFAFFASHIEKYNVGASAEGKRLLFSLCGGFPKKTKNKKNTSSLSFWQGKCFCRGRMTAAN